MRITKELLEGFDKEGLIKLVLVQENIITTQNEMIDHYKFNTIITQQAINEAIEYINDRA